MKGHLAIVNDTNTTLEKRLKELETQLERSRLDDKSAENYSLRHFLHNRSSNCGLKWGNKTCSRIKIRITSLKRIKLDQIEKLNIDLAKKVD